MNPHNLLRKQVNSELKKRRLIFFTIMFLTLLYLSISFTLGDTGLIRYLELKGKKELLERDIKDIETKNARLKTELQSLKENPFYIEKYARENFGMAKPDEYIFKYE